MSSEWQETTLGDHCDLTTGFAFPSSAFLSDGNGQVRLARGDNIKEGYFAWGDKEKRWSSVTPDLERFLLKEGDVLVGMDGSKVGKNWAVVSNSDLPCLLVQRVCCFRARSTLNQRLIRYLIGSNTFRQYIDSVKTGTSIPHISIGQIKDLPIPLPPLEDQKAIAHILGTLDKKIELNRKSNKTLEAMAKALFKSWFVDFDPVRAKAEGRPTGLPAEISDLFPDSFEDSELGEIPSGWVVANVGEVTDLVTKGTTPTSIGGGFSSEGIPFIKVESISDEGHIIPGKCAFIDERSDALLARSRIQEGDILFSIAGTIGRVAQMTSFDIPANTNQALAIARPNRGRISSSLLFYFLRERSRIDLALSRTVQSVQANFSLSELRSIPLALPKQSSRIALEDILNTIRKKVSSNQRNSFTVAAVRDALLPKLISGEIRIPDAEKMLEEVGV